MSDDRLPFVKAMDDKAWEPIIDKNQPAWSSVTVVIRDKQDCRAHSQVGTGCNAERHSDCKFGKESTVNPRRCFYDKWGIMCDKTTLADGTEVN
jgi:hypothetical protein